MKFAEKTFKMTYFPLYRKHVLDMTEGIEDQGYLRWQLVLCLLASWTVLFFSVIKGIKTSGKVP
jgi:hypothetical protein